MSFLKNKYLSGSENCDERTGPGVLGERNDDNTKIHHQNMTLTLQSEKSLPLKSAQGMCWLPQTFGKRESPRIEQIMIAGCELTTLSFQVLMISNLIPTRKSIVLLSWLRPHFPVTSGYDAPSSGPEMLSTATNNYGRYAIDKASEIFHLHNCPLAQKTVSVPGTPGPSSASE